MANTGLIPFSDESYRSKSKFLTFIVPSSSGCNLRCSFCFIRQRREISINSLEPCDYVDFISESAKIFYIYALAIQGHEPLLTESLPYTQAILTTGRLLNLPTAIVTNGTMLCHSAEWLADLEPNKIAISLDAASAAVHDRIRGVEGSWAATVAGIERVNKAITPATSLAVASVLIPRHVESLAGIPHLLRKIGIYHWIITLLQKVGQHRPGGPVGDREALYHALARCQDEAHGHGVHLTIDDELNRLQHKIACESQPDLRRFDVRNIPGNVELVRLAPDGVYSAGNEILQRVGKTARRWHPRAEAADLFLRYALQSGNIEQGTR